MILGRKVSPLITFLAVAIGALSSASVFVRSHATAEAFSRTRAPQVSSQSVAGSVPTYANNGTGNTGTQSSNTVNRYAMTLPNRTGAGNAVVCGYNYATDHGVTANVTDDKGNSYTSFSSSDGGQIVSIARALNVSAGASVVTVTFSGGTPTSVSGGCFEYYNIAASGADDGTCSGNGSGTTVACNAAITTTAGDDLIFQYAIEDGTQNPIDSWTPGASPWTPLILDTYSDQAFQYQAQPAAGSITPSMKLSPSQTWNTIAIALKSASGGTPPPAGIRVNTVYHGLITSTTGSPFSVQFPTTGNLIVAAWIGGPTVDVTGITDSNGNTYTVPAATGNDLSGDIQICHADNATPSLGLKLTVSFARTNSNSTLFLYDISGAAASPLDVRANATGKQSGAGNFNGVTITPTTASGVVISAIGVDVSSLNGMPGPTGGFFDTTLPNPIPSTGVVDEDNGWGHFYNTSASPVTFSWSQTQPVDEWASEAVAFKSGTGGSSLTTTSTGLAADHNPATVGQTVTFTATVTGSGGTPTGTVQFEDGTTTLGTATLNTSGVATFATSTLGAGSHSIVAIYNGDTSFAGSASPGIAEMVNNAPDTTPPTVSLTAPTGGATVSGTVSVTANASDNVAVASVQFQLDAANVGTLDTTSPYAFSWNTATATNGAHTLRAIAKDTSNNSTTSAGVTVTVNNVTPDTTPPTVSVTAPASGATVSGTVGVTANATDNMAVASVQFQLDGVNVGALDSSAPYAFSWNTATATNGAHTLRAIAKDTSNNSTTSAGVTITVNNSIPDTTPPTVPTGLTATPASSLQINLTWNVSTDNVGVTGYSVFRGGTKIGTSATTSYFDSGRTASTSYTYNVSAFDAAGNTSAQSSSASATTFPSSGGGGLPSTLGWYQIPNTLMSNVCPSGFNCANVIVPWSGGIADTTRNRLIVWGGGQGDYLGNEVYALNLGANPITLTRLNNPSPRVSGCTEASSDGTPPSRHTYDGLAYIAHVDRMMSWVGSMAPSGCATNDTWTLLLSNLQWTNQAPSGKYPGPNGGVGASDYDPNTKNVFAFTESYGQFASYNYDSNTWTALSNGQGISNETTAVVDPKRKLFLVFGAGQVFKIDISGNDTRYTPVRLKGTNCAFASAQAPGVAYDPLQDRIVGWSGGNTAYMYNPDTDSCTSVTYPNGPGAQQSLGTYGRFRYFPALGVFAVVNSASENAFILRLTQ